MRTFSLPGADDESAARLGPAVNFPASVNKCKWRLPKESLQIGRIFFVQRTFGWTGVR